MRVKPRTARAPAAHLGAASAALWAARAASATARAAPAATSTGAARRRLPLSGSSPSTI